MIRGEQIALAEMLEDYEIGYYSKEYKAAQEESKEAESIVPV